MDRTEFRARGKPTGNGAVRTVLVAGGAGFIGSHVCERLIEQGRHVVCVDNLQTGSVDNLAALSNEARFTLIEADILDALPARLQVDAVMNLACAASPPQYQRDPVHTLMTSVVGTANLLGLAEKCRARFLLASTSEVYGDPSVHPQPEGYFGNVNPTGPRACYDEGKRAAETLCFDMLRAGRVDVRVPRIFNTYGPRLSPDDGRVVSNVISQALAGDPITVYGGGMQTRSFCYVDDLVDGLLRLLFHPGNVTGPVNLGNPSEISIAELVALVRRMTGTDSAVVARPMPADDPRRRCPDIASATRLLGWTPTVGLADGLCRTIAWFTLRLGLGPIASRRAPPLRAAAVAAAAGD